MVQRFSIPTDEQLTIQRYKFALWGVVVVFVLALIGSIAFFKTNFVPAEEIKDCTCIEDIPEIVFDDDVNDIYQMQD